MYISISTKTMDRLTNPAGLKATPIKNINTDDFCGIHLTTVEGTIALVDMDIDSLYSLMIDLEHIKDAAIAQEANQEAQGREGKQ